MSATSTLPELPYDGFPLRRHQNGHWFKSVWNSRSKRSEQFYFGSWSDDPKGDRAMKDPVTGWLVRRDAIKAGIDNVRVQIASGDLTLGELMSRFLSFKRTKVSSGELSLTTLDGYLREVSKFVTFLKPTTPAGLLRPEHFSAFMQHLVEERNLGRHARKRVVTYISTYLRYGSKNGWMTMPNVGTSWTAPATDPDSMRVAKARAGVKDYSDRLVTGKEIDRLLARSQPAFRALILLGINCGLGPADLGRMRWEMIDLKQRRLIFPRGKSGVRRVGFLWKKTVKALYRVRTLKHNSLAIERYGEQSLTFITRKNLPFYREIEVCGFIDVDGKKVRKLLKVKIENSVLRTFRRMVRQLNIPGLTFYRLRHSFRTFGQASRDREALDACMGHKDHSMGRTYSHEEIDWRRIRRISREVYRRLWPKLTHSEGRTKPMPSKAAAADESLESGSASRTQALPAPKSNASRRDRCENSGVFRRQHQSREAALSG
jgi:integrase